jgi:hypothetical protein
MITISGKALGRKKPLFADWSIPFPPDAVMGAIFRSQPESEFECNLLFRHDPFCWDLYAVNNGAVYFYGKGAPLLQRFGGYWSHSFGGAWMMDIPFGNRLEFAQGNNN